MSPPASALSGSRADDALETASRFTTLLRRMGLADPDERPAIHPLIGGVSADIVMADTRRGKVCVKQALPRLKVAEEWLASPDRGDAERAWMRYVADLLPGVVPEILGEAPEAHAFAMRYLDPTLYGNWKAALRDGEVEPRVAAALGTILGAVHAQSAQEPGLAARFANDADFSDLRLKPYFAASAERNPDLEKALKALIARTVETRKALVHGDFSPKNILVGPDGPVVLDAECACFGDPAFDPAFLITHLLLKQVWRPAHAAGYRACIEAFRRSYSNAAASLDLVGLEERLTTLISAMLLARIDGKSPVEYLTDPADRGRVRDFARLALLRPPADVGALLERWAAELSS